MSSADGSERMVAAALDALPPTYRVFHDVGLPSTMANIDHLVVGPGGVVAIDSTYYEGSLKHGSGTLWRGKEPIRKECETARWEADVMSTTLQQPVESVLCFVEATLPEPIITLDRTVVCTVDALTRHLLTQPVRLGESEIEAVAAAAAPWVRTTSPRTVVSVSTTPDITTGSSRPGALPRREMKQPRRFLDDPEPRERRNTGVAVSMAFAIAFLLVMWVVWSRFDAKDDSAAVTTTIATVSTTAITDGPTTTAPPETTPVSVPLPPLVTFDCPEPGAGWTATPAASEFLTDTTGYNMWYQLRLSAFVFWGRFQSGLHTPEPLGGLIPGEIVNVKMDRDQSVDPDRAPVSETFIAPAETC